MAELDPGLLARVGSRISKLSIGLLRSFSIKLLTQQDCSNGLFSIIGGMAWEEIIDKNQPEYASLSSNDLDLKYFYKGAEPNLMNEIINIKNLLDHNTNYQYSLGSLLTTITEILIQVEQEEHISLNDFKPTLNDWTDILTTFDKSNFIINRRTSVHRPDIIVYSLGIVYKGLTIMCFEVSDQFEEYDYRNFYTSYMDLLNPTKVISQINDAISQDSYRNKAERARQRLRLIDDQKRYSPPFHVTSNPDYDFSAYEDVRLNEQDLTENLLAIDTDWLRNNSQAKKFFNCYSRNGDSIINTYLLQKELFGRGAEQYHQKLQNVFNENCHGLEGDSMDEIIENAKKHYVQRDKLPLYEGKNLNLLRVTRPSVYNKRVIESFDVGEKITFPNFLSTSYLSSMNISAFTDPFSPLVIFRFVIPVERSDSYMFIQNVSQFPHENEVLLKAGLTFNIIEKKYVTTKYNGRIGTYCVQKLCLTLELSESDQSSKLVSMPDNYHTKNHSKYEDHITYDGLGKTDEAGKTGGAGETNEAKIIEIHHNLPGGVIKQEIEVKDQAADKDVGQLAATKILNPSRYKKYQAFDKPDNLFWNPVESMFKPASNQVFMETPQLDDIQDDLVKKTEIQNYQVKAPNIKQIVKVNYEPQFTDDYTWPDMPPFSDVIISYLRNDYGIELRRPLNGFKYLDPAIRYWEAPGRVFTSGKFIAWIPDNAVIKPPQDMSRPLRSITQKDLNQEIPDVPELELKKISSDNYWNGALQKKIRDRPIPLLSRLTNLFNAPDPIIGGAEDSNHIIRVVLIITLCVMIILLLYLVYIYVKHNWNGERRTVSPSPYRTLNNDCSSR